MSEHKIQSTDHAKPSGATTTENEEKKGIPDYFTS